MGIHAIGAMRRAKLMIGGRILALAVQFTLARDATAQLAIDRACALSACPATVAENTGNWVLMFAATSGAEQCNMHGRRRD
jgi:hypothetical protein